MTPNSYQSVFGESRKDASRRMKRLSVVKITPKDSGYPIYREMCGEGKSNSDLVGGEEVVSKGSCFMYYWNHPFHATRISMRLGVASILLALISIVITLLV